MKRFILALILLLSCSAPAFSQKVVTFQQGEASQLVVLRDNKPLPVLGELQAKYSRGSKPEMHVVDYRDNSRTTRAYVAKKPPSESYPYFFLVEKGGLILAQGELAETTEANVAVVAKFQAKQTTKVAADVPPRAVMLQLTSGQIVGGIVYVGGGQYVVTDVTIVKLTDPTPTPPPITVGKRDIAIIRESAQVNAKMASAQTLLQSDPTIVQWKKVKGHRVIYLDPNDKDETGTKPSPVLTRYQSLLPSGQQLPAIVITDRDSGAVRFAGSYDLAWKASDIVELVKKNGG